MTFASGNAASPGPGVVRYYTGRATGDGGRRRAMGPGPSGVMGHGHGPFMARTTTVPSARTGKGARAMTSTSRILPRRARMQTLRRKGATRKTQRHAALNLKKRVLILDLNLKSADRRVSV